MILSALSFSFMDVFSKLSGDIPLMQKCFIRNLISLGILYMVFFKGKDKFHITKENFPLHLGRAGFGLISVLGNFYAVDHMLLSDASVLYNLAPFFCLIISFFWLKDKISKTQLLMIVLAFLGALMIIKPTGNIVESQIGAAMGLVGAMGCGVAYIFIRKLGLNGEKTGNIIFFFTLFSVVISAPFVLFHFSAMTSKQVLYLILVGITATLGQIFVTAAFVHAPAKEISVYDYTHVMFAAILGIFVFNQFPDTLSIFGYILICGVSVFSALSTHNKQVRNVQNKVTV